jgi:hypothetical protein
VTTDGVEKLAARLDKPVATVIASQDDQTKYFIGEALLVSVALYLLNRYADKYLEGLGFDDIAKEHGRATAKFLARIRGGSISAQDLDTAKADLETSITFARTKPNNANAHSAARADVTEMMINAGALRGQAKDEAGKVAEAAEALLKN